MARIVQCANFVAPGSGGLRTTLRHLAAGYGEAGHEVVQVVPGRRDATTQMPWGRLVELRAPELPGTGYRVIADLRALRSVLGELAPDRLEVHDRLTLRRLGRWAARRGIPSLVVSHERLDQVLVQWLPHAVTESPWLRGVLPVAAAADRSNRTLASHFDAVVCTTAWAAAEFARLSTQPARLVPLGVDLGAFSPAARSAEVRRRHVRDGELLLVACSRLSREKNVVLAVDALRELLARGVPARLVVAGRGPQHLELVAASAGLPVTFLGFLSEREQLAALLASADVVLAPGPVETFGLAALEALASGTPVVGNAASALPEVIGAAGVAAAGTPGDFADAVQQLLARPAAARRWAARARAEELPWSATCAGFLAVHRLDGGRLDGSRLDSAGGHGAVAA